MTYRKLIEMLSQANDKTLDKEVRLYISSDGKFTSLMDVLTEKNSTDENILLKIK